LSLGTILQLHLQILNLYQQLLIPHLKHLILLHQSLHLFLQHIFILANFNKLVFETVNLLIFFLFDNVPLLLTSSKLLLVLCDEMLNLLELAVHFCELVGEWGLGCVAVVAGLIVLVIIIRVVVIIVIIAINVTQNILLLLLQLLPQLLITHIKIINNLL